MTERSGETSAAAHGTARLPNTSTEQVIAELCEALDRALQYVGNCPEGCACGERQFKDKARVTLAKVQARGAAG